MSAPRSSHVIEEINYSTGVPDSQAPTTCTCGWDGLYRDFSLHRADASAADAAAAKEGVTMPAPSGPTTKQQEAWDLVHGQGLAQTDAAARLGVTQAGVQSRLRGYMDRMGITGPLPGYGGGNGPITIRRVAPELLDAPTTSAPTVADVEAVQAEQGALPRRSAEPAEPTTDVAKAPVVGDGTTVAEDPASGGTSASSATDHIREGDDGLGGRVAPSPGPGIDPVSLAALGVIENELARIGEEIRSTEAAVRAGEQLLGRLARAWTGLEAARDGYRALLAGDAA